jgi:hypothetical protein
VARALWASHLILARTNRNRKEIGANVAVRANDSKRMASSRIASGVAGGRCSSSAASGFAVMVTPMIAAGVFAPGGLEEVADHRLDRLATRVLRPDAGVAAAGVLGVATARRRRAVVMAARRPGVADGGTSIIGPESSPRRLSGPEVERVE